MSGTTLYVAPNNSTTTYFRAWIEAIISAINSVGLTQTSDTGQIDTSSVAIPTAVSTSMGYAIFAFADSLQSTYPLYLKIAFGSGPGHINHPAIWVTVGSATDGAGNLSGAISTRTTFYANGNSTVATNPSYVAGYSNRLGVILWPTVGSCQIGFWIERTHDVDGSDNDEGAVIAAFWYASCGSQYVSWSRSTQTSWYSYWNVTTPPSGTGAFLNKIHLYPVRTWTPGESSPLIGVFKYFYADLTTLTPINAVTWDGNTHSILPIGSFSIANGGYGGSAYMGFVTD